MGRESPLRKPPIRRIASGSATHVGTAQRPSVPYLLDRDWPVALRVLIPLMQESTQPMCVVWGDEPILVANEACRAISMSDHPAYAGKPLREVWPELSQKLEPAIARTLAGDAARVDEVALIRHRDGRMEEAHLAFNFTPIRDDSGDVVGALGVCDDLTQHVVAAGHAKLRTDLTDHIRELDSEQEVMNVAAERLGRHLGAQGVGYAEAARDGSHATITGGWAAKGFGAVAGTYDLTGFAPRLAADLRAGKPLVRSDVDVSGSDPGLASICGQAGARAMILAPAAKHGRVLGCIFVFSREPRQWTPAEIALASEMATPIWAVIHRLRVDAALKDSEARFRGAFENFAVGSGFAAPDGKFQLVNEKLCQITGYSRSELLQKQFRDITHPDDLDADGEHLRRLSEGEVPSYTREKRYIRKDGSVIWVSVSIGCVRDPVGAVQYYVGAVKDINEQKKAEEALFESKQRLEFALDAGRAIGTFLWDVEQDVVQVDGRVAAIFGVGSSRIENGLPVSAFVSQIHEDDRERVSQAIRHAVETGDDYEEEYRVHPEGGQEHWVLARGRCMRDQAGNPSHFPGVLLDVTERKKAQEELCRSRAILQMSLESGGMGVWQLDLQAGSVLVDEQVAKLFGTDPQQLNYALDELISRVHPDDQISLKQARRRAADTGRFDAEFRIVRPDGRVYWLKSVGDVKQDRGHRSGAAVGLVYDITEQKENVEALHESKRELQQQRAFLEAVIETAPIGFSIARDPMGEPPIINQEARRLTGVAEFAGDLDRYNKLGAIHRDGRSYEPDDYPTARALKFGEELRDGEMIYRRGDENRRWVVNSRPLRDDDGKIIAAVTAFADVEEQRRAEEHRKLLIAELNHRVKNTLAIVQALAQQTFKVGTDPDVARNALHGRLSALAATHDLLTRESWEKASLEQLVAGALQSCGVEEDRTSCTGPSVVLPPKKAVTIAMALHELSTNAMKYGALSNASGKVAVDWSLSDDADRRLTLAWRESGGPAVKRPRQRGFGTRMIERGLATELKGKVRMEFCSDGFVCLIEAPMPTCPGETG